MNEKRLRAVDQKTFQPVSMVKTSNGQTKMIQSQVPLLLARAVSSDSRMIRASLMKNDFLMRSLGRPTRDQIVSTRPNDLTTLEAMDLSNGRQLAELLIAAGKRYAKQYQDSPEELVNTFYEQTLIRKPTAQELEFTLSELGPKPTPEAVEDVIWATLMSPEFQFTR